MNSDSSSLFLFQKLTEAVTSQGFPVSGGVDFDLVPDELWQSHFSRYETWLEKNHHGEMAYLERGRDRRSHPSRVLTGAKSIFCVAIPYSTKPLQVGSYKFARYLRDKDYHDRIPELLETAVKQVKAAFEKEFSQTFDFKICVDTSAILERSWAALSGLGWIGKNTLLIHPQLGSYLFLAEVLLTHPLDQVPTLLNDYCGNCTRCLTACPTSAFPEPHVLDSRKCISYLTLEKRGAYSQEESQKKFSGWVAGCDICQEICPFNRKRVKSEAGSEILKDSLEKFSAEELLCLSETEYKDWVRESALNRIKFENFNRNLRQS